MEFLQTSFNMAWESFSQAPEPLQFLICLVLTLIGVPWLLLRAFPWLFSQFLQVISILIYHLGSLSLWPESLVSQATRRRNRQPYLFLYLLGSFFGITANIFIRLLQGLITLPRFLLEKRWLLNKNRFITISFIFSVIWFARSCNLNAISSFTNSSSPTFIVQTSVGYANLRAGPTKEHKVLAEISNGTSVQILGQATNAGGNLWYKVQVNGQVGWLYSELVKQK
jgi:Bacterial SH3 domain